MARIDAKRKKRKPTKSNFPRPSSACAHLSTWFTHHIYDYGLHRSAILPRGMTGNFMQLPESTTTNDSKWKMHVVHTPEGMRKWKWNGIKCSASTSKCTSSISRQLIWLMAKWNEVGLNSKIFLILLVRQCFQFNMFTQLIFTKYWRWRHFYWLLVCRFFAVFDILVAIGLNTKFIWNENGNICDLNACIFRSSPNLNRLYSIELFTNSLNSLACVIREPTPISTTEACQKMRFVKCKIANSIYHTITYNYNYSNIFSVRYSINVHVGCWVIQREVCFCDQLNGSCWTVWIALSGIVMKLCNFCIFSFCCCWRWFVCSLHNCYAKKACIRMHLSSIGIAYYEDHVRSNRGIFTLDSWIAFAVISI